MNELATRDTKEISITSEQVELIRKTVAKDATDDELKLYFYDCQRRGVHPLDKLIHFTKRSGRYTPVTSIDFMRTRAHESNECAGIDDAVFSGDGGSRNFTATVTVYRMVQGARCPFAATARWTEYYPGEGQFTGVWDKMPHTMLGKCAEALALRRAFPAQLSGLYEVSELDQAEHTGKPAAPPAETKPTPVEPFVTMVMKIDRQSGEKEKIKDGKKTKVQWTRYSIQLSDDKFYTTFDKTIAETADKARLEALPVEVVAEQGQYGLVLKSMTIAEPPREPGSEG